MANKNINILLTLQDKFSKPIKETTAQTKAAQKQIKACSNVINGWANNANAKFKKVAGAAGKALGVFATLGGAISVAGITAWSAQAMEAAQKQIEAETKLEAVLGNVKSLASGGTEAIKEARNNLMGVASELQKVGVIGDEVTLAGMQQLATFQLSDKEIATLAAGMTDLLAQQKGLNATQEDAVGIGNMIGKVMQGQTSALSRVGITFDKAQEKALKTGDATQRAAVLAEILQQNVGGVNAALAQTDNGKIQQAANLYGDMQEEVGKGLNAIKAQLMGMASGVIPAVQEKLVALVAKLQEKVNQAVAWFQKHRAEIEAGLKKVQGVVSVVFGVIKQAVSWVVDHLDILIPILAGVVAGFVAFNIVMTVASMLKTLGIVIQGVSAAGGVLNAILAANPAILVALAIAALVAAGVALYKNWDTIKEKAAELWGKVKEVFGGIRDAITGAFDAAKEKVLGVVNWIGDKLKWLGEKIESVPVLGTIIQGVKAVGGAVRTAVTGHATGSSYFQGGATRINEGGRGEIVDLPSGTRIIPHDVSVKAAKSGGVNVTVNVTVQGNVVGNRAFMEQTGDYITQKIVAAMATV